MNLTSLLWAVGCVALAASLASAQYPACSPVNRQPLGFAPDACGPGYYFYDGYGTQYGPTYNVVPPWAPYGGIKPNFGQNGPGAGQPQFVTHPYARSPRDYFMWTEAQQDRFTREKLPRFVP